MKEFTLSTVHPEPVEGKRYLLPVLFLVFVLALLTGCGTIKQVQVVERVQKDTLYLNHIQYDSIYVDNWHSVEYHPSTRLVSLSNHNSQLSTLNGIDTVFITEKSVEYKYRMLRDTVRVVQIDSIPVIKTVEVVKTERYVPGIYKWSLALVIVFVLVFVVYILWKIKF